MKRILSIILSLFMLLAFVACNDATVKQPSSSQSENVKENSSNAEPAVLDTDKDEDGNNSETIVDDENEKNSEATVVEKVPSAIETSETKNGYIGEKWSFVRKDSLIANSKTGTYIKGGAEKLAKTRREEILNTKNTENHYRIKGKKYYISQNGDNANDGTSPAKAVRDIFALDLLPIKKGDAILFERGSTWRLSEPLNALEGVTYGSYGSGEKPALYGSPEDYANKAKWTPSRKKNVWIVEFGYADVGNIVLNAGEATGYRKPSGTDALVKEGDFYHNVKTGRLYFYCSKGNPGEIYENIEICPGSSGIIFVGSGVGDIVIDNITMKYSGIFAVNCQYNNFNVDVTNCEIAWIGGSGSSGGLGVRYGNAIQYWDGAKDCLVENNWIYQTFDAAISWQGTDTHNYISMHFNNNLLEYNGIGVEIWTTNPGTDGKDGGGPGEVVDAQIIGNVIRNSGYGFGNKKDDAGMRGIEGAIRAETKRAAKAELIIKNNVFDCAGLKYMNTWDILGNGTTHKTTIFGNSYYQQYSDNLSNGVADFTYDNYSKRIESQQDLEEAVAGFDKNPKTVKFIK